MGRDEDQNEGCLKMPLPETLWGLMERIGQDLTIKVQTRSEDSYGRLSDLPEETIETIGFIDYSVEKGTSAVRSGSESQGTAVLYTRETIVLTPSENKQYIVIDKHGDRWHVKGRLQSIHNEDRLDVYNQYEITLVEVDHDVS